MKIGSQLIQCLNKKVHIQKVRKESIRFTRPQLFNRMNTARPNGQDARAKVPRAGDVVRCVANNDELLRQKAGAQMFVDPLGS